MIRSLALTLVMTGAFTLLPTAEAKAQIVNIGFERQGPHGRVGIGIGFGNPHRATGHWTIVRERVWVEGRCERVWIEPIYETRFDACGRPIQICIRQGYWHTVQHPGYWNTVERRVWVEGHGHGHGHRRGGGFGRGGGRF